MFGTFIYHGPWPCCVQLTIFCVSHCCNYFRAHGKRCHGQLLWKCPGGNNWQGSLVTPWKLFSSKKMQGKDFYWWSLLMWGHPLVLVFSQFKVSVKEMHWLHVKEICWSHNLSQWAFWTLRPTGICAARVILQMALVPCNDRRLNIFSSRIASCCYCQAIAIYLALKEVGLKCNHICNLNRV